VDLKDELIWAETWHLLLWHGHAHLWLSGVNHHRDAHDRLRHTHHGLAWGHHHALRGLHVHWLSWGWHHHHALRGLIHHGWLSILSLRVAWGHHHGLLSKLSLRITRWHHHRLLPWHHHWLLPWHHHRLLPWHHHWRLSSCLHHLHLRWIHRVSTWTWREGLTCRRRIYLLLVLLLIWLLIIHLIYYTCP
jgi:hypothetical protein